ncbi:MAG: hypothetical protein QNI88_04335 [Desulfobacterales bacterium]|nr:hypothetical protein [Desulfobacterales bacterium]
MDSPEIPILESLYDSQGRNDALITLMVELCHLLSACLRRDRAGTDEAPDTTVSGNGNEDDTIDVPLQIDPYTQLKKTLGKLAKRPGHDRTILIRANRLSSRVHASDQTDYRVYFSDIVITRHTVAAMVRRVGDHMTYLNALVLKAFQTLSDHNILTVFLRIPDGKSSTFEDLKTSLSIIARYQQALDQAEELTFRNGDQDIALSIMKDERSLPDSNLTLLAGLNAIKTEAMGKLVREVHHWIRASDTSAGSHRYASVYDAIAGVKNLRGKFHIPPIEMNNIRWFLVDKAFEKLPKAKAQLAWLIREELEEDIANQVLYLESLYAGDYGQIEARELGLRLKRLSAIIDSVGDRPKKAMIVEEVVTHLQWHMDRIPDEVLQKLVIDKGVLAIRSDEGGALEVGRVHDLIVRIVEFYTGRLETRSKMRRVGADDVVFNRRDHEILARDFDLSPLDVKEIIKLLKRCFDAKGRFNKVGFEACVESFARHEEKVFEILWHFLKQPMPREDRIAFLNALQLLFVKMKKPELALHVLLSDFLEEPDRIHIYDRNGIMLANLLLRRYNKELEIDIEITPEEVFLVREGLNRETAAAALMMIDQHCEAFFEKIRTIHRGIVNSLDDAVDDNGQMDTKHLLSLEREIHIFVSLLGGDIARSVLRSALNAYGNPDSEIYQINPEKSIFEAFLLHLKIILRGMGRAGDASDEWIIEHAANQREELIALSTESRHAVLVDRVLDWAHKARESIHNRQLTEVA